MDLQIAMLLCSEKVHGSTAGQTKGMGHGVSPITLVHSQNPKTHIDWRPVPGMN